MIVGGRHIVSATATPLTAEKNYCRVLTIRLFTGSGNVEFGDATLAAGKHAFGYLAADESWTWGPNAGTVNTNEIYVKGTAGNSLYWVGIPV